MSSFVCPNFNIRYNSRIKMTLSESYKTEFFDMLDVKLWDSDVHENFELSMDRFV